MAFENEDGVPKTRPVPQQDHIDAAQADEDFKQAVRLTMARENLSWPDAEAAVKERGAQSVLDAHNAPVAEAQVVAEAPSETKPADTDVATMLDQSAPVAAPALTQGSGSSMGTGTGSTEGPYFQNFDPARHVLEAPESPTTE